MPINHTIVRFWVNIGEARSDESDAMQEKDMNHKIMMGCVLPACYDNRDLDDQFMGYYL